mgnify:CR=1 FL=1
MYKKFAIAIDGPVASGKGTLAVGLAKKLNALYVYTGAMYPALALACLSEYVDIDDEEKVLNFFKTISIELKEPEHGQKRTFTVLLNKEDVSDKIHEKMIDETVPIVAAMPSIREKMVQLQKKLGEGRNVVMEGRDITIDVLPNADLKIYLTASLEERTRRRYSQLKKRGDERSFKQIQDEIKERDKKDFTRGASPLTVLKDAMILDTTNLSIEETIERVMRELSKKGIA